MGVGGQLTLKIVSWSERKVRLGKEGVGRGVASAGVR